MAWLSRIFTRRVLVNLAFSAVALVAFSLGNVGYDVALRDVQYFNGWILVGCMAVMMALTLRKRLVILPLARVRPWLQLHYYLGVVTIGVFLVHARFRVPDSPLEWLLWSLFILVAVSGLVGALLTKIIPPRLEASSERILFERIPVFRAALESEAEALVLESVRDGNTESIARLYTQHLGRFFARPRNLLAHLHSSDVPLARIRGELDSIERYLDEGGKQRLARLRKLVEAKNNLDFHYANGGLLKLWPFVHVPSTYALLVAIVVHVALGYAFSAGIA